MASLSEISNMTFSQFTNALSEFKIGLHRDQHTGWFIAKHTADTPMNQFTRNVRGMIIQTGPPDAPVQVVAPGVIVPLETAPPFELDFSEPNDYESLAARIPKSTILVETDTIAYIQSLYDGVMFRIYYHSGSWHCSTNGMVYPARGWHGDRSFIDLFTEVTSGFDTNEVLNPSLCYYVVIVHPDHHNVVKHHESAMYLTQAISIEDHIELTCDELREEAARINDESKREWFKFDGHQLKVPSGTAVEGIGGLSFDSITKGPMTGSIGFSVVLKDGNRYRYESAKFRLARALRGNVADVRRNFCSMKKFSPVATSIYLDLFPEDKRMFTDMQKKLDSLVELFFVQYGKRFKCKEYVVHHSRHVKSISQLHEIYNARRSAGQNNDTARITRVDVLNFLLSKDSAELFYLINPDGLPSTYGTVGLPHPMVLTAAY